MKGFAFLIGLLLCVSMVQADDLPGLEDAVARALAHSPEVAMAQARVSRAEEQLRSARWGWFHPEVRVYAGESAVTGTTRAGVQVSQDVMRLLTLNHDEVRQADHELALARQELTLARERLIRHVHEQWLTVQRLEQLVHLRAHTVLQREQLLQLARTTFEAGTTSYEHLVAAHQAHTQAEDDLRHTQNELSLAQVTWTQLLGAERP